MPNGPRTPKPSGNRTHALIFLVATILIVALYTWNRQQVEQRKDREEAHDRVCEVRSRVGADPVDCEEGE